MFHFMLNSNFLCATIKCVGFLYDLNNIIDYCYFRFYCPHTLLSHQTSYNLNYRWSNWKFLEKQEMNTSTPIFLGEFYHSLFFGFYIKLNVSIDHNNVKCHCNLVTLISHLHCIHVLWCQNGLLVIVHRTF